MSGVVRAAARGATSARCTNWITVIVLGVLALLPLVTVKLPPIHDYPGHLSRVFILDSLLHGGYFTGVYDFNPRFVPNLAFDVVTLGLTQIFGLYAAGIITVLLIQALTLSGIAALSKAIFGRIQLPALLGAVFINNWIFAFGFLNYLAGVGLLMWAVAAFLDAQNKPLWRQALTLTIWILALYAFHFVASVLLSIVVGCLILQEAIESRAPAAHRLAAFAWRVVPLLLPAVLYLALLSSTNTTTDWAQFFREWLDCFLNVARKIKVVWEGILSANPAADVLAGIVLAGLLVLVLRRGKIAMDRRFWLPAAMIVAATFIAPAWLGTGYYIDARLPVPALYLVLAATQLKLTRLDRIIFRNAIIGLVAARTVIFTVTWIEAQRYYNEYYAVFAKLPAHSTLYFATQENDYFPGYDNMGLWRRWAAPAFHTVDLASVERDIYVPPIWAMPDQQSIRRKPQYEPSYGEDFEPSRVKGENDMAEMIDAIKNAYETGALPPGPVYLMVYRPRPDDIKLLVPYPVQAQGSDFSVFALLPAKP